MTAAQFLVATIAAAANQLAIVALALTTRRTAGRRALPPKDTRHV
ncbi:hypothetical protein AB0K71_05940 [Streptomyces syringium]